MPNSLHPQATLFVVVATLVGLLGSILPTCLYFYVEPRGRPQWAKAGDSPSARRAPPLVRVTAWLGFATALLALPGLAVPAACLGLLYLQVKLGLFWPVGFTATAATLALSVAQLVVALRAVPLGVKLLVRDRSNATRIGASARTQARFNAGVLCGAVALLRLMALSPRLLHPWLRTTLAWSALGPMAVYAAVCLFHALLVKRSLRAVLLPNRSQ